jgi:2-C-methyl-D-erythritol 4-phosphate cytidylyltransferase/2-C-methyl-D-erythritol 2,4-cyclodiphosphate synthase
VFVSAIIAAGGRGLRFGGTSPKQLLTLGGRPILARSVDAFVACDVISEIVVALPADLASAPPAYLQQRGKPVTVVSGGDERRASVANAFTRVSERAEMVVIHDAARPLVSDDLIRRTVAAASEAGAAIAAIRAHDTVKQTDASGAITATLPRERIYLAQTPQAFRVAVLRDAHTVRVVDGDPRNLKITTPDDLTMAEHLTGFTPAPALRIGNGYDLHRLVAGRPLILGGVRIPFEKGLEAHSDGDVICHAVTDAVLGAAAAGDIGRHFPDTDQAWKNADSIELLRRAVTLVRQAGYAIVNVDVVVIAQKPKLAPHVDAIRANVAGALGCDASQVSVKGKTNEGVDSMGAGESIAAHAVALVSR